MRKPNKIPSNDVAMLDGTIDGIRVRKKNKKILRLIRRFSSMNVYPGKAYLRLKKDLSDIVFVL